MPIRGDRLRWPPRPGRRLQDAAGAGGNTATRRTLATDEKPLVDAPLKQPHERDESTKETPGRPRDVIRQAHDDIESGQQDTDCWNQVDEVVGRAAGAPGRKPVKR